MATPYRFERDHESQAPVWIKYETGADGKPQAVIPGCTRRDDRAHRLARAPLRARVAQKPCDVGLFSGDADQLDLCEMFQDQPEDGL